MPDAQPDIQPATPAGPPARPVPTAPRSPVEAAVARLGELDSVPLHQHPDIYQSIHAELQSALASIDDA